jgi:hypothetical protein
MSGATEQSQFAVIMFTDTADDRTLTCELTALQIRRKWSA